MAKKAAVRKEKAQPPVQNVVGADGSSITKKLTATEKRKLRAKAKKQEAIKLREKASLVGLFPSKDNSDVEVEYVSAPREYEEFIKKDVSEIDDQEMFDAPLGLGSSIVLGGAGLGAEDHSGFSGLGSFESKNHSSSSNDSTTEAYRDFERIFSVFATAEEVTGSVVEVKEEKQEEVAVVAEPAHHSEPDSDGDDEAAEQRKSKKKRKLEARLKIAELKQASARPEVVEIWDVTAQDPKMLVYLKSYRNTVPVPRHWSQKRKFLQGKRGIEKPQFKLPEYIEATGISQMRQAYYEKEEAKKLKNKTREKLQPKMGKLDIDYQVLHDAFFKFQTKPQLSIMGDLYYEGKEFEAKVRNSKPGILSQQLCAALGMTDTTPPPWLINMQRYGPPPSYPDLKVPGLNAPIPPGAQFGYQPGGWGKPPVDENGIPLYGDVFGQYTVDSDDEGVDKSTRWGDLESDLEESDEEEEFEEAPEAEPEVAMDGLESVVSGYSSLPSGLETPDMLDLRKKSGIATEEQQPLYQVLEQQPAQIQQGQIMGTDHTYVIPKDQGTKKAANVKKLEAIRKSSGSDLAVAIDPEELEGLDDASIKALYEQRLADMRNSREDFSDLIASKAAQQKRKASQKESAKSKKLKDKEFQF